MTANQIAAQANSISAQRNELESEKNEMTKRYNEWFSGETTRHNQALEGLQLQANEITSAYNLGKLQLESRALAVNTRLKEVELQMNFANEATKRSLEKEKNALEAERNQLQKDVNFETSRHNQALENISSDANYIQLSHNIAMEQAEQDKIKIQRLQTDINALNVAYGNALGLLNASIKADEVAAQREANENQRLQILSNYASNKRKQNLDYDLGIQQLEQTKVRDTTNAVINSVTGLGEVVFGRYGLAGLFNPFAGVKNAGTTVVNGFSKYTRDQNTAEQLNRLFGGKF